jgi:hypothetical protein
VKGRTLLIGLAVIGASGGAAMAGLHWRAPLAGWQEIAWPFPRDAWPAGRAFYCGSAECGGPIEAYVRPKLGFCNCATGVSGDAEVDGVADLDMITPDFVPSGDGAPVALGGMAGRARTYTLRLPDGAQRPGAGFAVSRRCDLVVVATQGAAAGSAAAARGVAGLIGSQNVLDWINARLGKG